MGQKQSKSPWDGKALPMGCPAAWAGSGAQLLGEETFLGQACGGEHSWASPLGTLADLTRTPSSITGVEQLDL